METKATGDNQNPMDGTLGKFTVDDIFEWLACSNEAATKIWTAGGLLPLFIRECERSVRKRVFRRKDGLGDALGDEIRGIATDLALQVYREFKPHDDKPSHRRLTLDGPENFIRLLRTTMARRASDRVNALVREPAIQARLWAAQGPEGADGQTEVEDLISPTGSGGGDGVAGVEGEMIDRYALKRLIEEIPPALSRFAEWMGKTRAKGPRRLLGVLSEVYRDDPVAALLVLVGDESPPELQKAFRKAAGADINPNTYYSHVRRLRVYFRQFREATGVFGERTDP